MQLRISQTSQQDYIPQLYSQSSQSYREYLIALNPSGAQILSTRLGSSTKTNIQREMIRQLQREGSTNFSRARLEENNRRQRNKRTLQIKSRPDNPLIESSQTVPNNVQPCLVRGKSVVINQQPRSVSTSRVVKSSMSLRPHHILRDSNKYLSPVGIQYRKRSQTCQPKGSSVRPLIKKKQEPLVLHPFKSKLKIKRIDDNPKILEKVIARKSEILAKGQLYGYINKLMTRRRTNYQ